MQISTQLEYLDPIVSLNMSSKEAIRPFRDIPRSVWGDQFLIYDKVCKILEISYSYKTIFTCMYGYL